MIELKIDFKKKEDVTANAAKRMKTTSMEEVTLITYGLHISRAGPTNKHKAQPYPI